MNTESKLNLLRRRFSKFDISVLLELLISCNGDVQKVIELLQYANYNADNDQRLISNESTTNDNNIMTFIPNIYDGTDTDSATSIQCERSSKTNISSEECTEIPIELKLKNIKVPKGSEDTEEYWNTDRDDAQEIDTDFERTARSDRKAVDQNLDLSNDKENPKQNINDDTKKEPTIKFVKRMHSKERMTPNLSLPRKKQSIAHQSSLSTFLPGLGYINTASNDLSNESGKGRVIHIYTPAEINQHLSCVSFHLNAFPQKIADDSLRHLLKESETFGSNKFVLFDRACESPHSTCLFSSRQELFSGKKVLSYNGLQVKDIRAYNDDLSIMETIVEDIVNKEINERGYLKYQYKGPWNGEVAVVNTYNGSKSSVGWHSDKMTQIGPHAVIAGVSLGVTREFRLKHKTDSSKPTFSIHLPHNSLVIMHAGCQEDYKHCVISNATPLDLHPISGSVRISLTYRLYRAEFTDKAPKCNCDLTMILRISFKGKSKGKYFWTCAGEMQGNGCGGFQWASFDSD